MQNSPEKSFILTVAASVLIIATTSFAGDEKPQAPAPKQETAAAPPPPHTGGSLLKATLNAKGDPNQVQLKDVSYTAVVEPEPRVLKKHDLVTIIVREQSNSKSEGTADLKKEMSIDAQIDQFIKTSLLDDALGEPVPRLALNGKRDFKGEATVDRTDEVTARITAEVVDVKPNGTVVLAARKTIKTDDDEQQFILTGICRAEDVNADNTVQSTQLHDLNLDKQHTGPVRDTTKRGWVPKLLDVLNPF